jgi:hypothetical protein
MNYDSRFNDCSASLPVRPRQRRRQPSRAAFRLPFRLLLRGLSSLRAISATAERARYGWRDRHLPYAGKPREAYDRHGRRALPAVLQQSFPLVHWLLSDPDGQHCGCSLPGSRPHSFFHERRCCRPDPRRDARSTPLPHLREFRRRAASAGCPAIALAPPRRPPRANTSRLVAARPRPAEPVLRRRRPAFGATRVYAERARCDDPVTSAGAPRPMKMGTTVSPWRYDSAIRHALKLPNLRYSATQHYTFWMPDTPGWSGYPL